MIDNSESQKKGSELLDERERVIAAVPEYVELCRNEIMGKNKSRFPNLAGFCRYLGIGVEALEEIFKDYPQSYDVICAVFEDEALNSELSPTIINTYLKQRLGYGEKAELKQAACQLPELKLVFDHDIFEDGG